MIIRTICDIMTSKNPEILRMMNYFEQEQADEWDMRIAERENEAHKKGFLRWTGTNPDWRAIPVAKLPSIFPRAFKAVQESDISVHIKDGKAHLHHRLIFHRLLLFWANRVSLGANPLNQ
jgi:hypothetical protein